MPSQQIILQSYEIMIPLFLSVIFYLCKYCVGLKGVTGDFMILQNDYRYMYPYIETPQVTSSELGIICFIPLFILGFLSFLILLTYCCHYIEKLFTTIILNIAPELSNGFSYVNICYIITRFTVMIYCCLTCTMMFTEVIKCVVGMPRPNFMAMCDYQKFNSNYTFYEENVIPGAILDINDCYADNLKIDDSISSFPSGHSSYTFSIAFSIFILLIVSGAKWLHIISFGAFILAFYVGISRIMDYYHNVWDVLFGFFLALIVNLVIFAIDFSFNLSLKFTFTSFNII